MNVIKRAFQNVKDSWLEVVDDYEPENHTEAQANAIVGVLFSGFFVWITGWHFLHELRAGTPEEVAVSAVVFVLLGFGGVYVGSGMTYAGIHYLRTTKTPEEIIREVTKNTESES